MQNDAVARYLKQYDTLTEEFVDTFSAFGKADFDASGPNGGWSPGEVVDHLLRSERGALILVNGPTVMEDGRVADAKCEQLEAFAVTKDRYDAPERLVPAGGHYKRTEMLDALVDSRAEIRVAVEFSANYAAVVDRWVHPRFGTFTILEWLTFTAMHGERHRRQIVARVGVS